MEIAVCTDRHSHNLQILVKGASLLCNQYIEVTISPISVVGTIVEYVDLIVMGTRGRSGFKRVLLGSTASGVGTYAHCPVLVVK